MPTSSTTLHPAATQNAADLTALLKVLGDPTRLRILGLLELEELSVGELSRALGMAQSRVSNHLRVLREAGPLLSERHVGPSTFVRSAVATPEESSSETRLLARLWFALAPELRALAEHELDLQRLRTVMSERRGNAPEFFDRVAADWDKIGVDFSTGQARQRVVANLLPPELTVADLGCGTGYFGRALLGLCSKLICVDGSEGMIEVARRHLSPAPPGTEVDFRIGSLDALPIEDATLDGVVCGMVLHHLPEIDAALSEMFRVLKPGGTVCVLELGPHKETWMREALGDRHLGLESRDVLQSFERCGLEGIRLEEVEDRYAPPQDGERTWDGLPLYLVRGRRPVA